MMNLEDKLAAALLEMLKGSHRFNYFGGAKEGLQAQAQAEQALKEYKAKKDSKDTGRVHICDITMSGPDE